MTIENEALNTVKERSDFEFISPKYNLEDLNYSNNFNMDHNIGVFESTHREDATEEKSKEQNSSLCIKFL